jgi:Cu-Zn family superoxide dismutase
MLAVAVFKGGPVEGEVVASSFRGGIRIRAKFSKMPTGLHGFHIHKNGDLRGEGCKGACAHWDLNNSTHGGAPPAVRRHTGDLGNVEGGKEYTYFLPNVFVEDLWGRSFIVHADADDLGLGGHEDSLTTGNSGARIACAVIGRGNENDCKK